jgi:hypothetical protein
MCEEIYCETYVYGSGYDKDFDGVFLLTSSANDGFVIKYNPKLKTFGLYEVDWDWSGKKWSLKPLKGYNLYFGCEDAGELIVARECDNEEYSPWDLDYLFEQYMEEKTTVIKRNVYKKDGSIAFVLRKTIVEWVPIEN